MRIKYSKKIININDLNLNFLRVTNFDFNDLPSRF